jgi:spore germination protein YaaH
MKKVIPVIIALLLFVLIGGFTFGKTLWDKYSYSTERADLQEYFQVAGDDQAAIMLQDEVLEAKALIKNNILYFDQATVQNYFDETFYVDLGEQLLLYATPTEVKEAGFGEKVAWSLDSGMDLSYEAAFLEDDVVYIAADYVKQFVNFSYEVYPYRVQVYTKWGVRELMTVSQNTALRLKGGIKSPILCDLAKGTQVEVLEQMDNWTKVKTPDAIIGYVENKRLTSKTSDVETPVTEVAPWEYTSLLFEGKVSLGWHAVSGEAGNDTLAEMIAGTKGMNVIAPTWYSIMDNEGNFRSFASAAYVEKAHDKGLQVWGVLDDFNYNNENDANLDIYGILSVTSKRRFLEEQITQAALEVGMDGINIDFERVGADTGPHYIQFLRELSVSCRNNGLVLSVDNYVPFNFNDYYRLDIQGKILDYVIIMGYDEHWSGSGDPGSVASLEYVKNGIAKALTFAPKEKVINALPLYTILWKINGAEVTDEYLTVANTDSFLQKVDVEPQWEEESCQYYLEWETQSGTYKIWLEEERSISAKLSVMSAHEIGGVAVWRLGYGNEKIWDLLNAYVNS